MSRPDDRPTAERVIERYHSVNRRVDPHDSARARVLFAVFERTVGRHLPVDRTARCLDLACGEGALLAYLRAKGFTDAAGIDLSPENVALCRAAGLDVRLGDVREAGVLRQAGSVDLVTAFDIVEHLPKPEAGTFVELIRTLLRPGGTAILQTPNLGGLNGAYHRYNDLTHEFGLTEKSAVDLALAAGFDEADVTVEPAWNATTALGRGREGYTRLLHAARFLTEGAGRPRIASANLLLVLRKR